MKIFLWKKSPMLVLVAALAGAGACGEVYDDGGVIEADAEPPPPQVEVVPFAPYAGAVWVGGRWQWRGGRHVWVGGRYVRGRVGYVYAPHRWDHVGNRWRYNPGRWHRR